MKKTFLLVAALATAMVANAQFGISVEAGYDHVLIRNHSVTENENGDGKTDEELSRQGLNGFHFGPNFHYDIDDNWGIKAGLHYQFATDNKLNNDIYNPISTVVSDNKQKNVRSLSRHALQIPIRASYKYDLGNDLTVFAFAGPKFDIGLALVEKSVKTYKDANGKQGTWAKTNLYNGKAESKSWSNGQESSNNSNIGAESEVSMFDIQLGLGVGVAYKDLSLSLSYDWGLLNLWKSSKTKKETVGSTIYKNSLHEHQLQLTLAYRIFNF